MSVTKVGAALLESGSKGADIASAGTMVIGKDGSYFDITGTTGITAMTVDAGRIFTLQFDGAVVLTHSSTLYLAGAANFTTEANDHLTFVAVAANDVRQIGAGLKDGGSPVAGGVNVHIAAGSWDTSTTGTIVITGAGFAPKGGVMFSFVQTVKKGGTWAVTKDGATDEIMYDYGGVVEDSYASNAGMVSLLLTDGSNYAKLVLTYDADGFTLTKSKVGSPTGTGYWKIFLVG